MKLIRSPLTMSIALAVCAPSAKYVGLPGYAHKTIPDCERTKPKDKYYTKCDWPKLGIKGFVQPFQITIGI